MLLNLVQLINPLRYFESKKSQLKRQKTEEIMAAEVEDIKPNPLTGKFYHDECWVDFKSVQEGQVIKLHTYRQSPDPKNSQDVKAVVIIFHGLNCHTGLSAHIAEEIAKIGIAVVGYDYRGFGKSEGIRGYMESEETHFQDASDFINIVEKQYPGKKIFIAGQSMGGMTTFMLGIKYPKRFAGSILFCPAIKDHHYKDWFMKKLGKVIGWILPKLPTTQNIGNNSNRNPQILIDCEKDPLIYTDRIKPGTIRNLLNCIHKCEYLYGEYQQPFLVIQGGVDKLVDPDLVQELMEQSPSKDKESIFLPKTWHDIWLEPEINEVIPKVQDWLLKRL